MSWYNISFFHYMGNFPLSMHDLKISSKGFKIESRQHANTDHVKAMSFIWIKIFNDISNVIFSKRDS